MTEEMTEIRQCVKICKHTTHVCVEYNEFGRNDRNTAMRENM
jgi:hypothetical protein